MPDPLPRLSRRAPRRSRRAVLAAAGAAVLLFAASALAAGTRHATVHRSVAVVFNQPGTAPSLAEHTYRLFTADGITVRFACTGLGYADLAALEVRGPTGGTYASALQPPSVSGARVASGTETRYGGPLGTTFTSFTNLYTPSDGTTASRGHVAALVSAPGIRIELQARVRVDEASGTCQTSGTALLSATGG